MSSWAGVFGNRARRCMVRVVLAGVASALLLSACSADKPPIVGSLPPDDATVYVVGRGWHTDIALPVEEITWPLATLEHSFPGVRFLTFGFGERQFLVTRQKSVGAMLVALLPSPSALLVTALNTTPGAAFGEHHVVTLHVSHANLEQLEDRLWQEFEKSTVGEPILLAEGPYPGSVFYAARDTYFGLYTCNTWTAAMLRSGGLPMATAGILFAGQVMGMARWIGAQQASSYWR